MHVRVLTDFGLKTPHVQARLALAVVAIAACTRGPDVPPPAAPATSLPRGARGGATVPMSFEENRVFVELDLGGPNGRWLRARTWVDTGGGAFILTDAVAGELGLARAGEASREEGETLRPIEAPDVRLGGMPLALGKAPAVAVEGATEIEPRSGAEAFLPARVLAQYDVIIDYPGRTFTLAPPGQGDFRGTKVPSPIHPESGFPRLDVKIDGKSYGVLLDTGASYSMASRDLLDAWTREHPGWPRMNGGVLEANMLGKGDSDAVVVRVPEIAVDGVVLRDVGIVSRREGTFEKRMSPMMTAPIQGALAGNALRAFRVGIDYAHGFTYLQRTGQPALVDLDSPGLVLDVSGAGFRVAGLASKNGSEIASPAQRGDRLVAIDGWEIGGATRGPVFDALRGTPGEHRSLRVERAGRMLEIVTTVVGLP